MQTLLLAPSKLEGQKASICADHAAGLLTLEETECSTSSDL
jgi:hypothetical protein